MIAAPEPDDLEILASLLLGVDDTAPELPAATGRSIRAVLEDVMVPLVGRPPCFVSFSGGRDSSAILAVAAHVARRHGLPDPVPAIMRFPEAPSTDETKWQRLVLDHLELEAEVVELRDDLDLLGPAATGVLRRHGVRWPANAYMHEPLFELARGGSFMTGVGGDELFQTRGARVVLVARRRERPRPRDVLSFAYAALPRRLRAMVRHRRNPTDNGWLTLDGRRLVGRALAREEVFWPNRYDTAMRLWCRSRAFLSAQQLLPQLGLDHDVVAVNPFLDLAVMTEFARVGGATGFDSRSAGMEQLFGDVLPAPVLGRGTKASFDRSVWGPAAREFATSWSGEGVDHRYVDVEELRREWQGVQPDFSAAMLLHHAWLQTHPEAGGWQGGGSGDRGE